MPRRYGVTPQTQVVFVYGLTDPRDGLVHYIGCTEKLNQRYAAHVTLARQSALRRSPCGDWLAALAAESLLPGVVILEVTNEYERDNAERRAIADHWRKRAPLTNVLPGGGNATRRQASTGADEMCRQCSGIFYPKRKHGARYCSPRCRMAAYRSRRARGLAGAGLRQPRAT